MANAKSIPAVEQADEITPGEVIESCLVLLPLAEQLHEMRPEVWSGEAVAFLKLMHNLACEGVQ